MAFKICSFFYVVHKNQKVVLVLIQENLPIVLLLIIFLLLNKVWFESQILLFLHFSLDV